MDCEVWPWLAKLAMSKCGDYFLKIFDVEVGRQKMKSYELQTTQFIYHMLIKENSIINKRFVRKELDI